MALKCRYSRVYNNDPRAKKRSSIEQVGTQECSAEDRSGFHHDTSDAAFDQELKHGLEIERDTARRHAKYLNAARLERLRTILRRRLGGEDPKRRRGRGRDQPAVQRKP